MKQSAEKAVGEKGTGGGTKGLTTSTEGTQRPVSFLKRQGPERDLSLTDWQAQRTLFKKAHLGRERKETSGYLTLENTIEKIAEKMRRKEGVRGGI